MRTLLSDLLVERVRAEPETVVLSGDHGYALFDRIRKEAPNHFINVGVMEQTMVGLAAGLAKTGARPIVYGLSAFVPIRVLEQIKIDVCHPELPVVFLGDGAGLVYSTLGVSHQCGEDLACLLPLPHLRVFCPADAEELRVCFAEAVAGPGPAYIRIGKSDRPAVHPSRLPSANPVQTASGAKGGGTPRGALVAMGSMVAVATQIACELGLDCFSVPRLKPFPSEFLSSLRGYAWVGVVEEHHGHGGLFSLLAGEWALRGGPTGPRWSQFSLQDHFTRQAGSYQHALSEHSLSDADLRRRIAAEFEKTT